MVDEERKLRAAFEFARQHAEKLLDLLEGLHAEAEYSPLVEAAQVDDFRSRLSWAVRKAGDIRHDLRVVEKGIRRADK